MTFLFFCCSKIRRTPTFETLPFICPLCLHSIPHRIVLNKYVLADHRFKDRRSPGILNDLSPLNTVRSKESSKTETNILPSRLFRIKTYTPKRKRRSSILKSTVSQYKTPPYKTWGYWSTFTTFVHGREWFDRVYEVRLERLQSLLLI